MLEEAVRDTLDRINKKTLNGASMLVIKDGKKIFDCCYGFSDIENKTEITKNTIFRLASMSKPITSVAVMLQADRGLLSLDDKLSKFIPEFADMKISVCDEKQTNLIPAKTDITLRMLLTHSSGLGTVTSADLQKCLFHDVKNETLCETEKRYADSYLDFEPGTKSVYSGLTAFDMLGRVVEITSGLNYDEFLKKNIFEPLSMNNTFFNPTDKQASLITNVYKVSDNTLKRVDMSDSVLGNYPAKYFSGAAGLFGTIDDYAVFALMLLNEGEYNGVRIISSDAVRCIKSPQLNPALDGIDENVNWGLGMRVITSDTHVLTNGSFGWSGAFGTHFWIDPKNNMVALYFKNTTADGDANTDTADCFEKYVMNAVADGVSPVAL